MIAGLIVYAVAMTLLSFLFAYHLNQSDKECERLGRDLRRAWRTADELFADKCTLEKERNQALLAVSEACDALDSALALVDEYTEHANAMQWERDTWMKGYDGLWEEYLTLDAKQSAYALTIDSIAELCRGETAEG